MSTLIEKAGCAWRNCQSFRSWRIVGYENNRGVREQLRAVLKKKVEWYISRRNYRINCSPFVFLAQVMAKEILAFTGEPSGFHVFRVIL